MSELSKGSRRVVVADDSARTLGPSVVAMLSGAPEVPAIIHGLELLEIEAPAG